MNHDREAEFLACYDAQADALFRHILLRVRDRDVAKDLTQEAFCRVWKYLAEGNEIANLRAFLYQTARNCIIDGARKRTTDSLDAILDAGAEFATEGSEGVADRRAEVREALAALAALDEPYRETLTLRFVDDFAPKEIAGMLGVSENVVSVRINRGLEKIRERLGVVTVI